MCPRRQSDSELQLKLWQLRASCSRGFHISDPSPRWPDLAISDNADLQHIKEDK